MRRRYDDDVFEDEIIRAYEEEDPSWADEAGEYDHPYDDEDDAA